MAVFSRLADSGQAAGAISLVSSVTLAGDKVITAVRDGRGNLKLISWRINPNGSISRLADSGQAAEEVLVLTSQVERITEETLVEYTITGKATGIQLKTLNEDEQAELEKFRRRKTTVFIESERLELAGKIDETPGTG